MFIAGQHKQYRKTNGVFIDTDTAANIKILSLLEMIIVAWVHNSNDDK